MKIVKTFLCMMMVLLALAGCAFRSAQPGMSQQEVIARNGTPSRVLPLGAGTRLQYSGQPSGQWAFMVDLDAAGRVIASRQVLARNEFSRIKIGRWTREDVEREFGRPAWVDHVASWPGDIMTYRWLDGGQAMYFWVYLDGANVVKRTGQGMEFPPRMFGDGVFP
ncbi:MAG: hypothetical protein A3E79_17105 [Burkholderiales bacterium RIFCSPHIGHO2_12_FULL_61_11]|nr:MAG: hypothetical protein A3E79_17105 [Burkholderiales bacterium RIFCSPHIGHO2_12_FULL_61_11]